MFLWVAVAVTTHKHNDVHRKFALLHLHFPLHFFLQLQIVNSAHAADAWGIVDHTSKRLPPSICQPHRLSGTLGMMICPVICPWYILSRFAWHRSHSLVVSQTSVTFSWLVYQMSKLQPSRHLPAQS